MCLDYAPELAGAARVPRRWHLRATGVSWRMVIRTGFLIGLIWLAIGFVWLLMVTRGFQRPTPVLDMKE